MDAIHKAAHAVADYLRQQNYTATSNHYASRATHPDSARVNADRAHVSAGMEVKRLAEAIAAIKEIPAGLQPKYLAYLGLTQEAING